MHVATERRRRNDDEGRHRRILRRRAQGDEGARRRLKAEAKRAKGAEKAAAEEAELLAKVAQMPDGDREMAERVHAIVTTVAPDLAPKLYYGQPGYARGGKPVVFLPQRPDGQGALLNLRSERTPSSMTRAASGRPRTRSPIRPRRHGSN
ncbi:hypothetical protein GCM10025768_20190 [Microbacterium pseudoresistens]